MSSYHDFRKSLEEEQSGMTKEEVTDMMSQHVEVLADLDNMPRINHRWVDRGMVMSCEDAGHPNHRHFKRLANKTA